MWSIVWQWVGENYPVMIGFAVVAIAVWFVAKFYYTRIVKVEERVAKLPCEAHEETNRQILGKLETIITYLMAKDSKASMIFSQKASPRKLNDYGVSLLEDCGGKAFLDQNKEMLLDAISAKKPQTALDVETFANEVLLARLDSDIFNELKQWVYNSPSRKIAIQGQVAEYAVTMNDICFVLSLPLRDMYLDLHPALKGE